MERFINVNCHTAHMPKMLIKMEKGKAYRTEFEELWQDIEEHMRNPAYAKTAKFTHKYLTGKA